jgi:hypothetical protein
VAEFSGHSPAAMHLEVVIDRPARGAIDFNVNRSLERPVACFLSLWVWKMNLKIVKLQKSLAKKN